MALMAVGWSDSVTPFYCRILVAVKLRTPVSQHTVCFVHYGLGLFDFMTGMVMKSEWRCIGSRMCMCVLRTRTDASTPLSQRTSFFTDRCQESSLKFNPEIFLVGHPAGINKDIFTAGGNNAEELDWYDPSAVKLHCCTMRWLDGNS